MLALDAHEYRMVGGPGAGRPLALACLVQALAGASTYYVGYSLNRHRTLVVVVVTAESKVHPVANEDRLEVFAYLRIAAVLRRAVGRPVQEHDLPRLARLF